MACLAFEAWQDKHIDKELMAVSYLKGKPGAEDVKKVVSLLGWCSYLWPACGSIRAGVPLMVAGVRLFGRCASLWFVCIFI